MTSDSTVVPLRQPETVDDPLTTVLREGARRLLTQAVEAEAEAFLASMRDARLPDAAGRARADRAAWAWPGTRDPGWDRSGRGAAGQAARPRRRRSRRRILTFRQRR